MNKAATCAVAGEMTYTATYDGHSETTTQTIPATGNHVDGNHDGRCDECNAQTGSPSQDTGRCKWCGKTHKGLFQITIAILHKVLAATFGARY